MDRLELLQYPVLLMGFLPLRMRTTTMPVRLPAVVV